MNFKNTISRSWPAVALAALFLTGCANVARQPPQPESSSPIASIIPAPREISRGAGQFSVTAGTRIMFADSQGETAARYLVDLVQRTCGIALTVGASGTAAVNNVIDFRLTAAESASDPDSYSLDISPERIVILASDARGLFYGAVTLWQLLSADSGHLPTVPVMHIEDAPRFAWRGLMLDSARHFQSVEFIKRFIDAMALHKLNVFHWHLVDDQGWRAEIKKYPQLTAKGAWRVPAGAAAQQDIDPKTGQPRTYGGYYTQDEIREVVAFARARHITVIPEIEMPGHATAAIVGYPQLAATATPPPTMPADWGIYPNLFNVEDETFAFLEDVLTEVIALFPSAYIHVGGDEAVKDQWQASPRVQERMRALGIQDEHALQSYFIQRMEQFLNAHGRRLIGWDEILEGGLPPNATVMSWRGIDGAVAAAQAGHDTVLSPWPTLYFDNRQYHDTQPGRGQLITLRDVYAFDPAPASLSAAQRQHILGVQANIWTEHMRTEARVEYMTFPRAAALAEVAWSPPNQLNWESFEARLPAQLHRYDGLGIRYAKEEGEGKSEIGSGESGSGNRESGEGDGRSPRGRFSFAIPDSRFPTPVFRTSHQLDLCSDKLVLSLEDDAPLAGERETFLVDVMQPCWLFPAVDLSRFTSIEVEVGQVPFNFQIGKDRDAIKFTQPRSDIGELEVRATCEGPVIAVLPLAPARGRHGVTSLPRANLSASGVQDLCFTFAQPTLDPLWVVHSVRLHAPTCTTANDEVVAEVARCRS
jgi:hexosaminidase